jgi:hypothetical protein
MKTPKFYENSVTFATKSFEAKSHIRIKINILIQFRRQAFKVHKTQKTNKSTLATFNDILSIYLSTYLFTLIKKIKENPFNLLSEKLAVTKE